jgi:hypothetical protein
MYQLSRRQTLLFARQMTTSLLRFCHVEFIIVPVVLDAKDLMLDIRAGKIWKGKAFAEMLNAKLEKQRPLLGKFYDGPFELSEHSFNQMKTAVTMCVGVTGIRAALYQK